MKNLITRLVSEEDGATMAEYALMVALIAAAAATVVGTLGQTIKGKFSEVDGNLTAPTP